MHYISLDNSNAVRNLILIEVTHPQEFKTNLGFLKTEFPYMIATRTFFSPDVISFFSTAAQKDCIIYEFRSPHLSKFFALIYHQKLGTEKLELRSSYNL